MLFKTVPSSKNKVQKVCQRPWCGCLTLNNPVHPLLYYIGNYNVACGAGCCQQPHNTIHITIQGLPFSYEMQIMQYMSILIHALYGFLRYSVFFKRFFLLLLNIHLLNEHAHAQQLYLIIIDSSNVRLHWHYNGKTVTMFKYVHI